MSVCELQLLFVCVLPGYLALFCQSLLEELDRIPGDLRTQIGFITFDRSLHFYNLDEDHSQPQMLVVSDVDGQRHLCFFSVRYVRHIDSRHEAVSSLQCNVTSVVIKHLPLIVV